jgi:hypothetical protein
LIWRSYSALPFSSALISASRTLSLFRSVSTTPTMPLAVRFILSKVWGVIFSSLGFFFFWLAMARRRAGGQLPGGRRAAAGTTTGEGCCVLAPGMLFLRLKADMLWIRPSTTA